MNKKYIKCFLIFILLLSIFILEVPINVYCDSINPDTTQAKDYFGSRYYNNESNNSGLDKDIYIIISTSIIVVGIMIFAMWKTIRSRKQL